MPFENLVALHVVDEKGYHAYREGMMPILTRYGGGFRYDFTVERTLKSAAAHPINRLFVITFPDRDAHARFFADPDYLKVRKQFFEPSVQGVTRIADYEPLL